MMEAASSGTKAEVAPQAVITEPAEGELDNSRISESNLLDDASARAAKDDQGEDEGPKSSAENIIPLEKLRNGWMAVSGFVFTAANTVKTKAIDAYNSEQVAAVKRRTSEIVTPAWEKTCEVAAPIWTTTVNSASYAVEKTKEGATYAVEKTKEGAIYAKEKTVEQWTTLTTRKESGTGGDGASTDPNNSATEEVPAPPSAQTSDATIAPPPAPASGTVSTGPPTIV